ncbi:MAG: response regulator [Thermoguttaceae bacterium]|jgi:two-component system chemotaxis response regulator CheY|nr:response regulator [Thermoguttaceae bacterium]
MKRFLIVDDDPACRRLLKHYLAPYGRCDLAHDGREAVAAFRIALEQGEPYDMILLDVMMPELDGHHVLDTIRGLEHARGIAGTDRVKVLMITAVIDPKQCVQAFLEGCEAYLTKPFTEEDLLAEIQSLLGDLARSLPDRHACASGSSPAGAPGSSARYLIVDDDPVCRELLKEILSHYGRCDVAYDGREAVDAVRLALDDGAPYDLVCLDIMMPGSSGHDALRAIRAVEQERGIGGSDGVKVIMTTALRDSKHCVRAFREGCESYVTKPIREGDLLARMRDLGLLPVS